VVPKRRRPRPRRAERRTILVVTNGKETEKAYFDRLKREFNRQEASTGITFTTKFINGAPLTIIRELDGPRSSISDYDEVWIVVDHDGVDRRPFLDRCRRLDKKHKQTAVHGVISVPCFEVWLNAHYEQVRLYRDQHEAQQHYRKLSGLSEKHCKEIPVDFPWGAVAEAVARCHLPTSEPPECDTQGESPSTTMPHLLRSLGFNIPLR
jgi:hypothetical protein avisC_11660